MNKWLVTVLIAVMALVLTAMVSIQIYWIKNAIALREQQFDNVHIAALAGCVNGKIPAAGIDFTR